MTKPKDDPSDIDFATALSRLVDVDRDQVDEIIEELESDDLVDLTDAVSRNDRDAAHAICAPLIKTEEPKEPKTVPDEKAEAKSRRKKDDNDAKTKRVKEADELTQGDKVKVDGREGVVRIANGPGGTVGVVVNGKMHMFDRDDVERLDETVVGFTSMPSLLRMQELAGIREPDVVPEVETPALLTVRSEIPSDPDECARLALEAVEQLACCLPNVRVSDAKTIRQRIYDLMTTLNESARPR